MLKLDLSNARLDYDDVIHAIIRSWPRLTHFTFRDGRMIDYTTLAFLRNLEFLDLCRYVFEL